MSKVRLIGLALILVPVIIMVCIADDPLALLKAMGYVGGFVVSFFSIATGVSLFIDGK